MNQNISRNRQKKNLVKGQVIKGFVMVAVAICMFFGIKTNALAATPTLTVDGKTVSITVATTGAGSSGGTWNFTPASGSSVAKLTLTNYQGGGIDYQYAPADLTIVLVGKNKITNTDENKKGIAFETDSNHTLTIEGTGALTMFSAGRGIYAQDIVRPPTNQPIIRIKASIIIESVGSCLNSHGKLIIDQGTIKTECSKSGAIVVNELIINGGNITAKSESSRAVYMVLHDPKFEINGGTLVATGGSGGVDGGYGSLYFNEGSRVIATSTSTGGASGISTSSGQIHFNGGEVLAQNTSGDTTAAIAAIEDTTGKAFYFGDSQQTRAMTYFEGSSQDKLKRVNKIEEITKGWSLGYRESTQSVIHIYPKLKASIQSNQKNATIKLTNKTPTYGSGPSKSITGIRGETISVSVTCAKDKKVGRLYYYKVGNASKKTTIDTNKKTFAMPGYDVVVGASIVDKVKVSKITLNKKSVTLRKGRTLRLSATIKPKNAHNKSLTWKSSNKKIATVSQNGVIKGKKYGTVTITATAKDGSKKKATMKVSVGYKIDYKLNGGKNKKTNPSTYYNQKVKLKDPVRVGYEFKGWYTNRRQTKKISMITRGKTTNYTLYAKWKKVKAPATANLTKVKNITGRKLELTLRTVKNADGYQIIYGTNQGITGNAKIVITTNTKKVIKGLKKGETYYIKSRAYQLDSAKKKVYGRYSKVEKVQVKK